MHGLHAHTHRGGPFFVTIEVQSFQSRWHKTQFMIWRVSFLPSTLKHSNPRGEHHDVFPLLKKPRPVVAFLHPDLQPLGHHPDRDSKLNRTNDNNHRLTSAFFAPRETQQREVETQPPPAQRRRVGVRQGPPRPRRRDRSVSGDAERKGLGRGEES